MTVGNLAAYSLQILVVILAAGLAARVTRLGTPGLRYACWRLVLLLCLALPWVQPWRATDGSARDTVTTTMSALVMGVHPHADERPRRSGADDGHGAVHGQLTAAWPGWVTLGREPATFNSRERTDEDATGFYDSSGPRHSDLDWLGAPRY